jgi:hypothetical protein
MPPAPPPLPPAPPPHPAPPANTVTGAQSGNVTFLAGNIYYISGQFGILAGRTLTIQAGVSVLYAAGASIVIKGGGLSVLGTASAPVTFTPQPDTDGSSVLALVFKSGVDYGNVVLQNAVFSSLGQSIVDDTAAGSNVGVLSSAANLTFFNTSVTFWPPITVANLAILNSTASMSQTSLAGAILTGSTLSFSTRSVSISVALIVSSTLNLYSPGDSSVFELSNTTCIDVAMITCMAMLVWA